MGKALKLTLPPLFILIFMVSVGPFGDTEYTPSLPRIAAHLHVHYALVQLTMTSYLFGYAISQLFYGPVSDKYGRKPTMLVGCMVFLIGSIVCLLSFSIWQLIAGRFVQAIGSCAGGVLASAIVRDAFPEEERGHVLAKVYGAFAVAPALGPIVGSFVDVQFGWHANFLVLVVLSAILFVCLFLFLPETNYHRDENALKPMNMLHHYGQLMLDPHYLPMLFIMGLSIGIVYDALIAAPNLVVVVLKMSSIAILIIAIGVLIGFVIGAVLTNYLSGKYKDRNLILTGILLMCIGSVILAVFALVGLMNASLFITVLPVMVIFAGIAFVIPLCTADAMLPFEHITGAASAMMGFFQMGIASLSTGLMSIFHHSAVFDMPVMFVSQSFIALIIFMLFVKFRSHKPRYSV